MRPTPEPAFVRRYLLGVLPEEEAERFEREYFESDGAFEELVAAENDLIDAHLGGRLTAAEEESFARHFLSSPEREERVAFAQALRTAAARAPLAAATPEAALLAADVAVARRPRVPAWLGWAAAVVCALTTGWSVMRVHSLERALSDGQAQADAAHAAVEDARRQESSMRTTLSTREAQVADLRDQLARAQEDLARAAVAVAPAASFVAVVLRAGAQRDINTPRAPVIVPAGKHELRLHMLVSDDPHDSYAARLETLEGGRIASAEGLRALRLAGARAVELRLDARPLANGEYIAFVSGTDRNGKTADLGSYSFRLKRD
jgi:hypothetical protein